MKYKNIKLSKMTTINSGGYSKGVLYPENYKELKKILEYKDDIYILGKGSNTLFNDIFYKKYIVSYNLMPKVTKGKNENIFISAFYNNYEAYKIILKEYNINLSFLALIPGKIAGAVVMNAGCYNYQISDFIEEVLIIKNNKFIKIKKSDCNFNYRNSIFKNNKNIFIVGIYISKKYTCKESYQELLIKKKSSQSIKFPTFGSVFKNNEKHSWWYIDKTNLRGHQIGGARISNIHSNFIENFNNATSKDIYNLINYCKSEVYKRFLITLNEEVILINF